VIKLLIADDHPLVRHALTQLLGELDDVELVGTAANGREAVALAERTAPDVVLMDLEMPELDGIAATHSLKRSGLDTNVVILTTFSDRQRIVAALDAGALGYMLKDAEPEEIIRGIRAAAKGGSPMAPQAAREMINDRNRGSDPAEPLSEREREVLVLVADGLPNKLIARRLEISEKTVKAHLTRVFAQIGVTDRTQAALWAHRNGLAPKDGG
jgi:DNA-binding NarL/FixJ family response regulator